jgi:hypothetical protein
LEKNPEHSDTMQKGDGGPIIPPTSIQMLKDMPLGAEEKSLVIACIKVVDRVLIQQPVTVRMRSELASAILAMACSSAFDSAAAQGNPEEAEVRYETFQELVILRARELFEMHL